MATLKPSSYHQWAACRVFPCKRTHRAIARASSATQPRTVPSPRAPKDDPLPLFLNWSVQNGIEGIGMPESKVSLYETTTGDRGLLCIQDIKEGEQVLNVPLRLALTDHPDDEESNALLYEGAPWSVRLAARLLRQYAQGEQSPWWPYLQALPHAVANPSETFTWEQLKAIQYEPVQLAIYEYDDLVADSYSRCSREALGGASREDYRWAMSVVHSRTFGSASRKGGVGARMLVPLVDMLNHGGDEAQVEGEVLGADNVRWDLIPPASDAGRWSMRVTATCEIFAGDQVVLSYGERPNDDFFVHYGFVPPRNAHDEVALFKDLEEALDWHYEQYNAQLPLPEAEARYRTALQAGLQDQLQQQKDLQEKLKQQQQQQQQPLVEEKTSDELPINPQDCVKITRGNRISNPLMVAFSLAGGGDTRHAEAAVARRCRELLQGMSRPYLQDLAVLARDAEMVPELAHDAAHYLDVFQHYQSVMSNQHASIARRAAGDGGTGGTGGTGSTSSTSSTSTATANVGGDGVLPAGPASRPSRPADVLPPGLMAVASAITGEDAVLEAAGSTHVGPQSSAEVPMSGGAGGGGGDTLKETASSSGGTAAGVGGTGGTGGTAALEEWLALSDVELPLTSQQRMTVRFLADKKRLLWDWLIAVGPAGV